jgi:uncharacterized membrane protein YbhN (UPF0104 family)
MEDQISNNQMEKKSTGWRRTGSLILRLTVSIALVVWIFRSIDWGIFKDIIISPKLYPLVPFIIFSLFFVFLGSLKLWMLLRTLHPMGLWRFSAYYFLASSIGSLIPSIFGDFTLAALMKKNQIDYHKSFSIIILDRLITLLTAVFIFTPFTLIFVLPVSPIMVWTITAAALAITLLAMWILASFLPTIFQRFSATRRFWEATTVFFHEERSSLWGNVLIGLFRGVISGVTLFFALMVANLTPDLFLTVCIANSLAVVTHIPISISGLGLYEGGGLILFEHIGLQREMVLAGLLYQRAYILVWSLATIIILGFVIFLRRHGVVNAKAQKNRPSERELPL